MERNPFLIPLVVILVLASCSIQQPGEEPEVLPNIIYVLADDLGYGDVGCFNPESMILTPHLDRMAAEGMKFTDAHSSSAVCTPTRYGLMTGRYNWRTTLKNGVLSGTSPPLIDPERETVASLLKNAGYRTAFIGKWHLGWNWSKDSAGMIDFSKPVTGTPNSNGFDYTYGHCGSLDMTPYVYVENGRSTAIPVETTENRDYQGFWRKGLTAPDFDHGDVTPNFFRRSFELIKSQAEGDAPFFLYLPLPSPHTPILPTAAWQGRSGLNPYGDFVMMVDDYMGQLLKTVKEAGIEENTLIIFTSDNGCSPRAKFDELAEKGHYPSYIFRGSKADIFEGGHRIPFIAKWPSVIGPGKVCEQTICLIDFMATCASISKFNLPDNAGEDSYDLLPLFKAPQSADYLREAIVHHSINGSFAIRKGEWKYILCDDSGGWSYPRPGRDTLTARPPYQLYNLVHDPGEKENLLGKYPEIELELMEILSTYIAEGRSTPGENQENDPVGKWPQVHWMENE